MRRPPFQPPGNVTVLEAHEDIEVILQQTRVLLAPSLWQECCPLVGMEATLRGESARSALT